MENISLQVQRAVLIRCHTVTDSMTDKISSESIRSWNECQKATNHLGVVQMEQICREISQGLVV